MRSQDKYKNAKVYSYIRVSTAMQADGYSLDAQRQRIADYADYKQMKIVREYSDEGFSGKSIEGRPHFQEMIADIKSRKDDISFVLVFKLSRFGRNAADTLNSLQLMQDHGVDLICVDESIDSSEGSGKLMISLLAALAEIERENISTQTMSGRYQKAQSGEWNGGFAPYGYDLKDGKLVVNKSDAKIVTRIFKYYTTTLLGANGVAKRLNDEGYSKRVVDGRGVPYFTGSFIKKLLDNPLYYGVISYGRRTTKKVEGKSNAFHTVKQDDESKIIIAKGVHQAIVSKEIWDLAHKKRIETGVKKEKKEKDHEYILSGLIVCPKCGHVMYGVPSRSHKRKDGTKYPTYYSYMCRCSKEKNGIKCNFGSVSCKRVDSEVISVISNITKSATYDEVVREQFSKEIDSAEIEQNIKKNNELLQSLYRRQSRLETELDNLDQDSTTFEKEYDSTKRRLQNCFEDQQKLEEIIINLNSRLEEVHTQRLNEQIAYDSLQSFDKIFEKMTEYEQKMYLQTIIDSIELKEDKKCSGNIVKMIRLKFPIYYGGEMVKEITLPKENHDECVCLLTRNN